MTAPRPAGAHRRPRPPRRLRLPAAAAALVLGIALVPSTVGPAGAAVGVPTTYAGPTYDGTVTRPSENKPQSKLWYTAGAWWGLLVSKADNRVHIWELLSDKTWRDTGVQVDDRLNATGDAHWDEAEQKLTVASRTKDTPLKVNRFTLTGSRTWVRDAGFPVTVSTGGGHQRHAEHERGNGGRQPEPPGWSWSPVQPGGSCGHGVPPVMSRSGPRSLASRDNAVLTGGTRSARRIG